MTIDEPATVTDVDADLMTRREVAQLFRSTSAAVAAWARRGRLPEVRDEAAGLGTGVLTSRSCCGTA